MYGLLDIPDPDIQIRKSRRCSRHTKKFDIKRKSKSKSCRTEKKNVSPSDDTLPPNENDLKEVKPISNDFDLPDQCDACCSCQTVFTNLTDKVPRDTPHTPVSDTLEVPWNPLIYDLNKNDDLTSEDNHHYERETFEESVLEDGEVVCTLVVPPLPDLAEDFDHRNITTADSDKDSGVYSEEQSFSNENLEGQLGQACSISDEGTKFVDHGVEDTEYSDHRDDHLDYLNHLNEDTEYMYHMKSESEVRELLGEDCKKHQEFISPFERKVWKRRNGRYKVRNPMCPPQVYKATINYADHDVELGSERSEETGPNYREHFKFLRDIEDIETGKECNLEIERENCISVNEGTSDSGLPGEGTLDSTIQVNVQQTYHGHPSDFQARLAQMKLEIAEMVAEAVELDNILGESGDEINDVISSPDRHYTMQPENFDFSEAESNDSESVSEEDSQEDSDDVLSDYDYISSYSD